MQRITKIEIRKFRFSDDYCYHANKGKGTLDKGLLAVKQGYSKKIEGANANLLRKSEFLSNAQLTQLAEKIWPVAY